MATRTVSAKTATRAGVGRPARAAADRRPLTMPEQIADSITAAILRGEYQPGDPVREQELADSFQVSRGPIREALRILEKAGVVTIFPQRGAYVTSLSRKEIDDLYEIRCTLARLLPRHLGSMDEAALKTLQAEVIALEKFAGEADGVDAYAQGSYRISQQIFRACDNERLGEILQSLANQTARYTRLGLLDPARRKASAKGWRKFVSKLKAGDTDAAGDALVGLLEESRKGVLKALA
jgi:DNA-binding GntR family transcriptional regulator